MKILTSFLLAIVVTTCVIALGLGLFLAVVWVISIYPWALLLIFFAVPVAFLTLLIYGEKETEL